MNWMCTSAHLAGHVVHCFPPLKQPSFTYRIPPSIILKYMCHCMQWSICCIHLKHFRPQLSAQNYPKNWTNTVNMQSSNDTLFQSEVSAVNLCEYYWTTLWFRICFKSSNRCPDVHPDIQHPPLPPPPGGLVDRSTGLGKSTTKTFNDLAFNIADDHFGTCRFNVTPWRWLPYIYIYINIYIYIYAQSIGP